MPGHIDPKFREKHATWWDTIKFVLIFIGASIVVGAAALVYLFTEILPSLNH